MDADATLTIGNAADSSIATTPATGDGTDADAAEILAPFGTGAGIATISGAILAGTTVGVGIVGTMVAGGTLVRTATGGTTGPEESTGDGTNRTLVYQTDGDHGLEEDFRLAESSSRLSVSWEISNHQRHRSNTLS